MSLLLHCELLLFYQQVWFGCIVHASRHTHYQKTRTNIGNIPGYYKKTQKKNTVRVIIWPPQYTPRLCSGAPLRLLHPINDRDTTRFLNRLDPFATRCVAPDVARRRTASPPNRRGFPLDAPCSGCDVLHILQSGGGGSSPVFTEPLQIGLLLLLLLFLLVSLILKVRGIVDVQVCCRGLRSGKSKCCQ